MILGERLQSIPLIYMWGSIFMYNVDCLYMMAFMLFACWSIYLQLKFSVDGVDRELHLTGQLTFFYFSLSFFLSHTHTHTNTHTYTHTHTHTHTHTKAGSCRSRSALRTLSQVHSGVSLFCCLRLGREVLYIYYFLHLTSSSI